MWLLICYWYSWLMRLRNCEGYPLSYYAVVRSDSGKLSTVSDSDCCLSGILSESLRPNPIGFRQRGFWRNPRGEGRKFRPRILCMNVSGAYRYHQLRSHWSFAYSKFKFGIDEATWLSGHIRHSHSRKEGKRDSDKQRFMRKMCFLIRPVRDQHSSVFSLTFSLKQ